MVPVTGVGPKANANAVRGPPVAPKANVTPKPSRLGFRRRQVFYRAGPNLLTCLAENDKWKN